MSICKQCGSQQPDGTRFCNVCGAPMGNAPQPESTSLEEGWVEDPQTDQPLPKPEPDRQPEPYQPPVQPYQEPQYVQQAPPAQPYPPVPPTPPAAPNTPENNKKPKKKRVGFVIPLLIIVLLGAGYFGYNWMKGKGLLNPRNEPDPRGSILPEGTDPSGDILPGGEDISGATDNPIRDFLLGDEAPAEDGVESLEEELTPEERASYLEALMARSQEELDAELAKGAAGDQAKIKEIQDFLPIAREELKKLKQ